MQSFVFENYFLHNKEPLFFKEAKIKYLMGMLFILNTAEGGKKTKLELKFGN